MWAFIALCDFDYNLGLCIRLAIKHIDSTILNCPAYVIGEFEEYPPTTSVHVTCKSCTRKKNWLQSNSAFFHSLTHKMMLFLFMHMTSLSDSSLFVTCSEEFASCNESYFEPFMVVEGLPNVTTFPEAAFACQPELLVSTMCPRKYTHISVVNGFILTKLSVLISFSRII